MTTAIIGVGHLGSALAQHLVRGSEPVVLAAEDQSHAQQVATALGPLATAAPVREAISQADTVVLAVWLDSLKQVVAEHSDLLNGKVIVDPTNPLSWRSPPCSSIRSAAARPPAFTGSKPAAEMSRCTVAAACSSSVA